MGKIPKVLIPKEFLELEYVKNRKSVPKISKETGYSYKSLYESLIFYNIPRRSLKGKDSSSWKEERHNLPPNYCKCGKEIGIDSIMCHDCNNKNTAKDIEFQRLRSEGTRKWWKNRDKKDIIKSTKKMLSHKKIFPNKPEKILIDLLNNILPKEYKYVGNFKFFIESKNPDFININGQKKIIEFFGDFWHANPQSYKSDDIVFNNLKASQIWEEDEKRLKIYKKYGYKTLIIWQHELKDLNKIEEKILQFHGGK